MRAFDYSRLRVAEAIRPSLSPFGVRGLGQPTTGNARFFDLQGNTITSIECGQAYMFEVPGYTDVWLTVKKDGNITYDSGFAVPMPAYTADCTRDPGHYELIAKTPDGTTEIARASLDILPSPSLFAGIPNWTLAAVGVGLLLLMRRKRG